MTTDAGAGEHLLPDQAGRDRAVALVVSMRETDLPWRDEGAPAHLYWSGFLRWRVQAQSCAPSSQLSPARRAQLEERGLDVDDINARALALDFIGMLESRCSDQDLESLMAVFSTHEEHPKLPAGSSLALPLGLAPELNWTAAGRPSVLVDGMARRWLVQRETSDIDQGLAVRRAEQLGQLGVDSSTLDSQTWAHGWARVLSASLTARHRPHLVQACELALVRWRQPA